MARKKADAEIKAARLADREIASVVHIRIEKYRAEFIRLHYGK
jgi:hypothetical protein